MINIRIKNNHLLLLCLLIVVFSSSCVSKKNIVYFQDDEIDQEEVSNSYKTIIKPDDLLQIGITARDLDAVRPFNVFTAPSSGGGSQLQSYLVNNAGEIDFPIIGNLKIGGLSRDEVIKLLKDKLSPDYVKDPNVNISIVNYKISILGDVKSPGSYTIPNERITILEALGLAGDTNISGQRDNVLVIREQNGKKIKYSVDLRSNNLFTSPVYYLQQNDVVYVEQNYAKSQAASTNPNTTLFISIVGLLFGIAAIFIR
jgi:polysaccharide export outer membrane protein